MEGMGVIPICRTFHRSASSTPQAAGVVETFKCFYIILSTMVSFLELMNDYYVYNVSSSFLYGYISIIFAITLCMCVMCLTSFDGLF